MGNDLIVIADLHKEQNVGLQKKVLVPFLIADAFLIQKFIVHVQQTRSSSIYCGEKENKQINKYQGDKNTFFNTDNAFVGPDSVYIYTI